MKKRAQVPDAHTFTIIFRGCADHPDPAQALAKVLGVYQSMLAANSPIKPNTIHMNAVLKMCSRANDMNALFGIAGQMPKTGVRAPNNLTFTTIFNAMRNDASKDLRGDLTPIQKKHNIEKAILDARRIWDEITTRWRQGDIWIDEELVCAMGRTLLLGSMRDNDDVLSLLEQAMNIPRQIPRVGTVARARIEPSFQGKFKVFNVEMKDQTHSTEEQQVTNGNETSTAVDYFQPIMPLDPVKKDKVAYAKPGRNALSLSMEAFLNMGLKAPATIYWKHFTEKLGIRPDSENFHNYLRILRVARASTEALELLQHMPTSYLQPKTFRIAMSTCHRDKRNPNAFANSGKILDLMQSTLKIPDIEVLVLYLQIAKLSVPYSPTVASDVLQHPSKYQLGKQILRALERLNPSYINIRSIIAYGKPGTSAPGSPQEKAQLIDATLRLTRYMIGAYDMLILKALVGREAYAELQERRGKLSAYLIRHRNSKDKSNPSTETDEDH